MNAAANTASHLHDRNPLTALDCKIMNKIAAKLIQFGAASEERLIKVCKLDRTSVAWALWHLRAELSPAGLYMLPE